MQKLTFFKNVLLHFTINYILEVIYIYDLEDINTI